MINLNQTIQQPRLLRACLQSLFCLTLSLVGSGQVNAQTNQFEGIIQRLQAYRQTSLQEKIYLHLDRQVYVCGDEMWFKLYNVDGTLHQPLEISKVAYVELLDGSQKPALQAKVALKQGLGSASFQLPASLQSGNYTVRAYTSWMKNFSPEFYFEQPVTIINTFEQLPAQKEHKAEGYTLQFFPEGGNLVAGVTNKVAFKITDLQSGKGASAEGVVYDQAGNKIADLKPYKFGMGHFVFTPAEGVRYTANLTLPGNRTVTQALPQVYERGYTLQLEEMADDRLRVAVQSMGRPNEEVYLLGHARQQIVTSDKALLLDGKATFVVDKASLADGITHFTVFNTARQPVCERLYFRQPSQKLQLALKADKGQYSLRDKVTLSLRAKYIGSAETMTNLSMAVYRLDSLQHAPERLIESYIWLESDLKGVVEEPTYYFSDQGRTDLQAIENLMLTHGWSRFKWEDVLQHEPATHPFLPEYHGHLVQGKVTHKNNGAPAQGITTFLASPGSPIRFYNAISDSNGRVLFELKDYYGSRDLVMQTDFTRDSTYHFELLNPFSLRNASVKSDAFQISESLLPELTTRHIQVQLQHAYHGPWHNRFRNPGIDSTAFYGQVSERYRLDDYKRFKVMEEVMREYVQGVQVRMRGRSFHFMVFNRPYKSIFRQNPMVLVDGVPVFDINRIMTFDPLKVNKLDVITGRFFHGPLVYEGLVSYQTYLGDLAGFELDPRALMQAYEGLQLQREFYAPAYDTEEQKQSRLADFRELLHWAPDIRLISGKDEKIQFYTSEQTGTFLVVVQGMTVDGKATSKLLKFNVEGPVARK